MKIPLLSIEEVLRSLHTGREGLTSAEAARRLREFGPNRIERVREVAGWRRLGAALTHFLALVLWVAAALAFVAEAYDPGKGMATLGFAILGVIFLNGFFSFFQEFRAERALRALERLMPSKVSVWRDGTLFELDISLLVPGDVIQLGTGDDIPADCRLIEAYGVQVNTATVTGEAFAVRRDAMRSRHEDLIHSTNILLAGTSMMAGEGRAVVFATGMHTEFGRIARLTQAGAGEPSPLQREIVHLSRLIAALALTLGVVFFGLGQWVGLPWMASLLFAVGIIVANVPEGLLPTVTLSLAMGAQRMASRKALIRHLPAVETLGSAAVICTDKTGTLTLNRLEARAVFLPGERVADLTPATGLPPRFRQIAARCNALQLSEDRGGVVGDPIDKALLRMAQAYGPLPEATRVNEWPFDAERRMTSTLYKHDAGHILYCKGAPEAVLARCTRQEHGGMAVPVSEEERTRIVAAERTLADRGLRVLALAYRQGDEGAAHIPEQDLVLSGLVGLEDPPRPEVPQAIARCAEAGIKVIMVTGDHPHTAAAVARAVGLAPVDPVVITGEGMAHLSPTQLRLALDAKAILFARVTPEQKLQIVTALQQKGAVVAVTGDGVNDAPALRQADIGIAMGISGTDVAREAADIVLLDDNFATIVAAVEEGRAVFQNIRRFLTYILTSNIPEIVPYLAFVLFPIPLPLTVVQILAVDLGTDMLPALALGAEHPDPETMRRPPRGRKERLLKGALLARAYLFLGPVEALAAMATFFFVLQGGGWRYGEHLKAEAPLYLEATTGCLSAIIVMQVVNVFVCRSERRSLFAGSLVNNRLIVAGVLVEILLNLVIAYTEVGNRLFGTAPLGLETWLFTLPFAFALAGLDEARKAFVRGAVRRHG